MAMRIKWVGHATYEISSATGTTLVIDPWYTESPVATTGLPDKTDFVPVTHDHWDHVKDVAPLARSGAKVVTQPEVAARLTAEEGVSHSHGCGRNRSSKMQRPRLQRRRARRSTLICVRWPTTIAPWLRAP